MTALKKDAENLTPVKPKPLILLFVGAVFLAVFSALLVFGGVLRPHYQRESSASDYGPPQFDHRPVAFADLPGWAKDDLAPAFSAFLRSCEKFDEMDDDAPANPQENLGMGAVVQAGEAAARSAQGPYAKGLGGQIADWREPCAQARAIRGRPHATPVAAQGVIRSFFEIHFRPMQILVRRDPPPQARARQQPPVFEAEALFTGYFEPAYRASRNRAAQFESPLYPRPDNLVDVDLGAFRDDLKGERIAGRLEGGRLVPYWDRRAINDGALADSIEPLAWVSADDLFFLQIQGSGQLLFGPDDMVRMGYAAQNGQPYTAIGRVMVERGLLQLEDVTMQSIRDWLKNVDATMARELREQNASYVFFRELGEAVDGLGPPGAQGVALTPERSIAVDRRFHTLGAPIWVDIDPVFGVDERRIQKLMIAQDTGGAIKGPLRGDVFWGAGSYAADVAGRMNVRGQFYVLTPKSIAARLSVEGAP